jgi:hypothetical protein
MGLIILQAIAISWFLIDKVQWHYRFKFLSRKPFNCEVCMTGWAFLALDSLYYHHTAPIVETLSWMCVSMLCGYVFFQLIGKYL